MKKLLVPSLLMAAMSGMASAQAFTEIGVNPPGNDNGFEFIELMGSPSASLAGYFVLVIEGDSIPSGTVDQVINIGSASFGTNGLLLMRDAAGLLDPNHDAATNIFVQDFTPDIENGTNTFVLCTGTPPAVGTDLDAENDGVIDAGMMTGWTVVDALGANDNLSTDLNYAHTFGSFFDFGAVGFSPDTYYRTLTSLGAPDQWVGADIANTSVNPGPYTFSTLKAAQTSTLDMSLITQSSPGLMNVQTALLPLVTGNAFLSDYNGDISVRRLKIEVMDQDSGFLIGTYNAIPLDATGNYEIGWSWGNGTFDLYFTVNGFLRKLVDNVVISGAASGINAVLTNGDYDRDNEVGPGDFSLMSLAFGSVDGDANWNIQADGDGDGEVGPSDFSILSNNFGDSGD